MCITKCFEEAKCNAITECGASDSEKKSRILFHQNSFEKFRHCKLFSTMIFNFFFVFCFVCVLFFFVAVFDLSHKYICIWKTFWNQKNCCAAAHLFDFQYFHQPLQCISHCANAVKSPSSKWNFIDWNGNDWKQFFSFSLLSVDLKFSKLQ